MDTNEILGRIFNHVDNREVDKAVRECLRLSRNINDYFFTGIFLWELHCEKKEVMRILNKDAPHLNKETLLELLRASSEYWMETRAIGFSLTKLENKKSDELLVVPAGEIPTDLEQCEKSITDLVLPGNMGEFDTAAFTDRHEAQRRGLRLRIRALNTIKSNILNRCQNFAIQVERQLDAQQKSVSFLQHAQNEVQNYFKHHSQDIYDKLENTNQLIISNDKENFSLILTQVRRIIKSVADHFYPKTENMVTCSDGVERVLDDEHYLNRLQEFISINFKKSTSSELIHAELDYLAAFVRKLNGIASKGVHTEASLAEAKQGFIGVYMFLFNVCSRLTEMS